MFSRLTSFIFLASLDEITPALVADDDKGLYPALRLHYYLTVGRDYLKERALTVLESHLKRGKIEA